VVEWYVRAVREHGEDSALLLLPNRLACERTRRRLASGGDLPGLLDPRILTFPDLAQLILDANHAQVAALSPLQQRLLMRSLVRELCAEERLPTLGAMCEFPGFIDGLCGQVEEIKRTALRPDEFTLRLERSGVVAAQHREFALIYERYQGRLQELKLFDDAGRFWWARDVLGEGNRRPFEDLREIFVDGFDDFTTTQLQVLELLARDADRLVITLCLEPRMERRPELFALPIRTRERVVAQLGDLPVEWLDGGGAAGTLAAMGERLFAEGDVAPLPDPGGSVEIIQATGRRMEVHQVAARVKRLIRDGVAPNRIAIIARDLDAYGGVLLDVLGEAGVPLRLRGKRPVGSRPPVQAVLDVLRVPAEGFRASDVLRLVKSNYFDRSALGGAELDPDEIERVAFEANIIGGTGTGQWTERLRTYATRLRDELRTRTRGPREDEVRWFRGSEQELQAEIRLVERVAEALSRLFQHYEALMAAESTRGLVEALAALLARLGIDGAVGESDTAAHSAANIAAFDAFLESLRGLWAAGERLGIDERTSLQDFHADVARLAESATYSHPGPQGAVLALAAHEARQLDFDHVFVIGMGEREFPRVPREDALFSDDDREALSRAGIPLDPRRAEAHEDAFLFYSLCTAPRERLTLSYPTADAEGREALASWYIDEVRRCFEQAPRLDEYGVAQAVPGFDDALSPDDLLQRAVFELYGLDSALSERERERAAHALGALAAARPGLVAAVRRAIEVEDRRDSRCDPDEYDGRLADPAAREAVRAQFGPDAMVSAGALAQFGNCPFAFFAERVLGLAALEEPVEDVDAMLLGGVRHRCLSAFFDRWQGRTGRLDLTEDDLPAATRVMDEVIDRAFDDEIARGAVADRTVFNIAREETRRDLHLWLAFEVERIQSEGHTATWREQSFGFHRTEPVVIGEGEERVRLRGRIDRVDRLQPIDGRPAFAVYDYKSSEGPSSRRIEDGRDFQLPVYALAARDLVLGDPDAACACWGYYKVRRPIHMRRSPNPEKIAELIATAIEFALAHAAAIRSADFTPRPQDCRWCDFRGICRWDEYRFARKEGGEGDG